MTKKLKIVLLLILLVAFTGIVSCPLFDQKVEETVIASEVEELEQIEYEPGETLTVDVKVTNTGNAEGTQTIYLDFGSEQGVDSEEVTLSPDDVKEFTLSYDIPKDEPAGEVTITVRSDDTEDTATITILEEETFFEVEIIGYLDIQHNFRDSIVQTTSTDAIDNESIETYNQPLAQESVEGEIIVKVDSGKDMQEVAKEFIAKGYTVLDYL